MRARDTPKGCVMTVPLSAMKAFRGDVKPALSDHREPPESLAPDCDCCPCGAPVVCCPVCHGEGGWFEPEEPSGPCVRCKWKGVVCSDEGCGGPTPPLSQRRS